MVDSGLRSRLSIVIVLLAAILLVLFGSNLPPVVWFVAFPVVFFAALIAAAYVLARVSLNIW